MSPKYPVNVIYFRRVSTHNFPSETWLNNDKHLLEYLRLPGYEFAYQNRDEKRGGGVAIYVRDTIEFKVRNDITKLDQSIEHLWVEIQGRKKNSACLIGIF